VTIKQIAETVKELIGNVEIVYTPARPGDFGGKIVSSQRAKAELGWTAATPFSEGVGRYVAWRREQAAKQAEAEAIAVIPAGEPDAEARPRHVLIISADIGEGHDLPARAVAREFRDEDPDAQISIVQRAPGDGPDPDQDAARELADHVPLAALAVRLPVHAVHVLRPTRWFARRMLTALGRRGLMRLIRAHNPT